VTRVLSIIFAPGGVDRCSECRAKPPVGSVGRGLASWTIRCRRAARSGWWPRIASPGAPLIFEAERQWTLGFDRQPLANEGNYNHPYRRGVDQSSRQRPEPFIVDPDLASARELSSFLGHPPRSLFSNSLGPVPQPCFSSTRASLVR